jgi:hypothetical protein
LKGAADADGRALTVTDTLGLPVAELETETVADADTLSVACGVDDASGVAEAETEPDGEPLVDTEALVDGLPEGVGEREAAALSVADGLGSGRHASVLLFHVDSKRQVQSARPVRLVVSAK